MGLIFGVQLPWKIGRRNVVDALKDATLLIWMHCCTRPEPLRIRWMWCAMPISP
jgi:hypothetical protein